jgi:hypothetical protein
MDILRQEDERATLRQEEVKMDTLRREDERWIPFTEKMRGLRFSLKPEVYKVVCEVYDMKFILGGVLEYRNSDFRCIIFMSTM